MQTKARLAYAGVMASIVGSPFLITWLYFQSAWGPARWLLLAAPAIALGVPLRWPRCPHCDAGVLQHKWDWLWPPPECPECGQVYDLPLMGQAELAHHRLTRLRTRYPAAADRFEAEERELASLRQQAPKDPEAAKRLKTLLLAQAANLEDFARGLKDGVAGRPDSPAVQQMLRELTRDLSTIAQEVSALSDHGGVA